MNKIIIIDYNILSHSLSKYINPTYLSKDITKKREKKQNGEITSWFMQEVNESKK
jgi:hypothetical protein